MGVAQVGVSGHAHVADLSVSSADRVWVWRVRPRGPGFVLSPFSILGGSSVGVARALRVLANVPHCFQYPRRIECGCGVVGRVHLVLPDLTFSILGGSSVGVAGKTT